MARVTVEDCILKIPNRFDLVMVAGQRAREISAGGQLTVERNNDKNPVVALREIADGTVDLEVLRETLVRGHQKHIEMEEPEEEIVELMAGEEEFLRQSAVADGAIDVMAGGVDELDIGEDAAEEMLTDLVEQATEEEEGGLIGGDLEEDGDLA